MTKSPCNFFGICGGCNYLDLDEKTYQNLKIGNLTKILKKINLKPATVDYLWIGPKSRRKITLKIDVKNKIGFFAKGTNSLVEIDKCFVAEEKISSLILPLKKFLQQEEENLFTSASITLFDNICDLIFSVKRELNYAQIQRIISFAKENNINISYKLKNNFTPIFLTTKNQIFYPNFKINLNSEIFIQATKLGLDAIIKIISEFCIEFKKPPSVVDLYAGFGAYSFGICNLVKKIHAFEGDAAMADMINSNASLNDLGNKVKATSIDLFNSALRAKELKEFDLAIINPPRNGATPQIKEIAKSDLKNVIYVSCNPVSFAMDAKILIDSGFKIIKLTALDQFYSTNHQELISIFKRT